MVMCCAKLGDNLTARALINGETVDDNYDDLGFVPYWYEFKELQVILSCKASNFNGKYISLDYITDQIIKIIFFLPQGEKFSD